MQYFKEELDTLKSKESTSHLQQKGREGEGRGGKGREGEGRGGG